ncbi:MAG: DUF1015 family protein [candidate division WOR-3 bacterium]
MSFLQKFKAVFFEDKVREKIKIRLENYFSFLEKKDFLKNHPFYEFVKKVNEDGFKYIESLFKKEILKMDEEENFYIYEQEFKIFGNNYLRRGLLCNFNMDYENKIFPHEQTFDFAAEIHKNFYEKSKLNFEPVLLLYKGEKIDNFIEKEEFLFETQDEYGEIHRIKRCDLRKDFFEIINKSELVIADGHHRFEAIRKSKFKKRLTLIFSIEDENLKVLPTHRGAFINKKYLEHLINKSTKIEELEFENFLKNLKNPYLIFFNGQNFYLLKGEKNLSVEYLHNDILKDNKEKIGFYRDYKSLINDVKLKKFNVAFFLPPITPEIVFEYAIKKIKFPPKSTDFYPKTLCGFIGLKLV